MKHWVAELFCSSVPHMPCSSSQQGQGYCATQHDAQPPWSKASTYTTQNMLLYDVRCIICHANAVGNVLFWSWRLSKPVCKAGRTWQEPGSSNDQTILVVLVIVTVFHANGRKLAQNAHKKQAKNHTKSQNNAKQTRQEGCLERCGTVCDCNPNPTDIF